MVRLFALSRLQDGISVGAHTLPDNANRYLLLNEMLKTCIPVSLSCRFDLCNKSLTNRGLYKRPVFGDAKLLYLGESSIQFECNVSIRESTQQLYRYSSTVLGIGKIY